MNGKNKERDYKFTDRKFVFMRADGEERLVATLNDANQVEYELGCKGAHGKTLEEWISKNSINFNAIDNKKEPDVPAKKEKATEATDDQPTSLSKEPKSFKNLVDDIPPELFPAFDKMLGADGAEFKAFVKKHKLNETQITALVRHLEKK